MRRFSKNDGVRPYVLMPPQNDEKTPKFVRTIYTTSRYKTIAPIPANDQERLKSKDAEIKSRSGDYKDIFWNAVGVAGAFDFTLVVAKNAIANADNPATYGLVVLWSVTALGSLDPFKHTLDDQKHITNRIEDANEAIDAHDECPSFSELCKA